MIMKNEGILHTLFASSVSGTSDPKYNVPAGRKIMHIYANQTNGYAIDELGQVWAWGLNNGGQLGDGTTGGKSSVPQRVLGGVQGGTYLTNVKKLAVSDSGSSGVDNVVVLALTNDNHIYGWGCSYSNDMLGTGSATNGVQYPSPIDIGLSRGSYKFLDISANFVDTYVLVESNSGIRMVYGTGYNAGNSFNSNPAVASSVYVPVKTDTTASAVNISNVKSLSPGGGGHILSFLGQDDIVYTTGFGGTSASNNERGHGAIGEADPKVLAVETAANTPLRDVKLFSTHRGYWTEYFSYSLAVDKNNVVWGWGKNKFGQIGDSALNSVSLYAKQMNFPYNNKVITNLSTGMWNSALVDANGNLYATGTNGANRLHNNASTDVWLGFKMVNFDGSVYDGVNHNNLVTNAVEASIGGAFLYLTDGGAVYARGENASGQLGQGTTAATIGDFQKIVFPIKPQINAERMSKEDPNDANNTIIQDNTSTNSVHENEYNNTYAADGTPTSSEKYNKSIVIHAEREKDTSGNQVDYGEMFYQYCALTVGTTNCAGSWSNAVSLTDQGDQDIKVGFEFTDQVHIYRKYRFYYDEVKDQYDTATSGFNPYSEFIVDLKRGNVDAKLNIYDETGSAIENVEVPIATGRTYTRNIEVVVEPEVGFNLYQWDYATNSWIAPQQGSSYAPLATKQAVLIQGTGKFKIVPIDAYGNQSEYEIKVYNDRHRPVIDDFKIQTGVDSSNHPIYGNIQWTSGDIPKVDNGWVKGGLTFAVGGSDTVSDTSYIENAALYKVNDQKERQGNAIFYPIEYNPTDVITTFPYTDAPFTITENGNYELSIQDFAMNQSANTYAGPTKNSKYFKIDCIDNTAPTIDEPLESKLSGQLHLQLSASDAQSGVVPYNAATSTAGIFYQIIPDTSSTGPNANNWIAYDPSTTIPIPANTVGKIYIKAVDAVGNVRGEIGSGEEVSYRVVDDSGDPIINYLTMTPTPPAYTNQDVEIAFEVWDNESGIEKVVVENLATPYNKVEKVYDASTNNFCKGSTNKCDGANSALGKIKVDKNGVYTITAYDLAGNTTMMVASPTAGNPTQLSINHIDKDAPSVTISRNSSGELILNFVDALSGFQVNGTQYPDVEYRIDTATSTGTWTAYDTSALPDVNTVPCTVYARVKDQAGNSSAQVVESFTVMDLQPPQFGTVSGASSSQWRRGANGGFPIHVDITDNDSGIDSIEVKVQAGSSGGLVDAVGNPVAVYKESNQNIVTNQNFTFYAVEDGNYEVTAIDKAGNATPTALVINVQKVDHTLPSANVVVNKYALSFLHANQRYFEITQANDPAGIQDISYQLVAKGATPIDANYVTYSSGKIDLQDGWSGFVYVRIKDQANLNNVANTGNETILIQSVEGDDEAPYIDLTTGISGNSPTLPTNQPTVVSFLVKDDDSGIESIHITAKDHTLQGIEDPANPNTYVSNITITEINREVVSATYQVQFNASGEYTIEMIDYAGNRDTIDFKIENVDCVQPTIQSLTYTRDANTKKAIIDIQAEDRGGSLLKDIYYQFSNQSPANFTIGTLPNNNGSLWTRYDPAIPLESSAGYHDYIYVIAMDHAGNVSTVSDQLLDDDFDPPVLTTPIALPAANGWNNQDVSTSITVTDNKAGIKRIRILDEQGNVMDEYNESNRGVLSYTMPLTFTTNGTYTVEMMDYANNLSNLHTATNKIKIKTIDKVAPVIDHIAMADTSLFPILFPTGAVEAHISDHDEPVGDASGIDHYLFQFVPIGTVPDSNTANWKNSSTPNTPMAISSSFVGDLYVIAVDKAGNESVTKIVAVNQSSTDASGPTYQVVQGNPTAFVGPNATISIEVIVKDASGISSIDVIDSPSGITGTTSFTGSAGTPTLSHTLLFDVSQNGIYTIKGVDIYNNESTKIIQINKFDTTAPTITDITTSYANGSLSISLQADDHNEAGVDHIYYQFVQEGSTLSNAANAWTTYSNGASEILPSNYKGSIFVKSVDKVGNESRPMEKVITIDTDKPTIQIGSETLAADQASADFPIRVKDATSGVAYYVITGNGISNPYVVVPSAQKQDFSSTITVTKNGTYLVSAYDYVGNPSDLAIFQVSDIVEVSSGGGLSIRTQTIKGDPAVWLKDGQFADIEVLASDPANGIQSMEIITPLTNVSSYTKYVNTNASDKANKTLAFQVSENGIYTIRITNTKGEIYDHSVYVTHFDKQDPQIEYVETKKQGTSSYVEIHARDDASGLKKISYELVGDGASPSSSWTSYTIGSQIPITATFSGDIYVKLEDQAGNIYQRSYRVQPDMDNPDITVSSPVISNDKKSADISMEVSDPTSGVQKVTIIGAGVSGSGVIESTTSAALPKNQKFTVTANGLYILIAEDAVGHKTTTYVNVSGLKEDTQQGGSSGGDNSGDGSGGDSSNGSQSGGDSSGNGNHGGGNSSNTPDDHDPAQVGDVFDDAKTKLNYDTDGDGLPDINLDPNGTKEPCLNIDIDGDGIPDVDIDTDGDGEPDINIDIDHDGKPDKNICKLSKWAPEKNITLENGFVFDTMADLVPDNPDASSSDNNVDGNSSTKGVYTNNINGESGGYGGASTGMASSGFLSALGISVSQYWWWYLAIAILSGYCIFRFGILLGKRKNKRT